MYMPAFVCVVYKFLKKTAALFLIFNMNFLEAVAYSNEEVSVP